MVISGTLELVDQELSNIAIAAKEYSEKVEQGFPEVLSDFLSSTSVTALTTSFAKRQKISLKSKTLGSFDDLLKELSVLKIHTTKALSEIFESVSNELISFSTNEIGIIGLVRTALILHDYESEVVREIWTAC